MSEKIVQLIEEVIRGEIKELVPGRVESLNGLLEAEAEKLTQSARYPKRYSSSCDETSWDNLS